jgi:thymidine kinase
MLIVIYGPLYRARTDMLIDVLGKIGPRLTYLISNVFEDEVEIGMYARYHALWPMVELDESAFRGMFRAEISSSGHMSYIPSKNKPSPIDKNHTILIRNAHVFDNLFGFIDKLRDKHCGITIIIEGQALDARHAPYPQMVNAIAHSEQAIQLRAPCNRCQKMNVGVYILDANSACCRTCLSAP